MEYTPPRDRSILLTCEECETTTEDLTPAEGRRFDEEIADALPDGRAELVCDFCLRADAAANAEHADEWGLV